MPRCKDDGRLAVVGSILGDSLLGDSLGHKRTSGGDWLLLEVMLEGMLEVMSEVIAVITIRVSPYFRSFTCVCTTAQAATAGREPAESLRRLRWPCRPPCLGCVCVCLRARACFTRTGSAGEQARQTASQDRQHHGPSQPCNKIGRVSECIRLSVGSQNALGFRAYTGDHRVTRVRQHARRLLQGLSAAARERRARQKTQRKRAVGGGRRGATAQGPVCVLSMLLHKVPYVCSRRRMRPLGASCVLAVPYVSSRAPESSSYFQCGLSAARRGRERGRELLGLRGRALLSRGPARTGLVQTCTTNLRISTELD